jgi:hypothetical protein
LTVENREQKDEAEFKKMEFQTKAVGVDGSATSLVLIPLDTKTLGAQYEYALAGVGPRRALEALACAEEPMQSGDWCRLLHLPGAPPVSKDTFDKWRKKLSDEGFVENSGTSPARYRVSEKGWSVLGEPVASQLGVHHPPATPPPLGGGVERREEERQTVI